MTDVQGLAVTMAARSAFIHISTRHRPLSFEGMKLRLWLSGGSYPVKAAAVGILLAGGAS